MFKKGDLCKHFKGKNLVEKNIYEIVEVDVKYTGENDGINDNLIVYKNIFQEGKVFVREEKDLIKELEQNKQEEFGQKYRIEKLTIDEIKEIQSDEFKVKKLEYMNKRG